MDRIAFLMIFLLLLSSSAFASITIVQHAVGALAPSAVKTLAVGVNPTGSGNLIVAATEIAPNRTVSQITDGTTFFTQVPGARATDTLQVPNLTTDIWYLPSSNSGKTTITVTFSGNATNGAGMEIWEVSGFKSPVVDTANILNNGAQAGNTATGATVTTANNHGYMEFVAAADQTSDAVVVDPAPGNEFTSGGDIDSNDNAFCSLITSLPKPHTPAWTDYGANFCASTAAFMESTNVQTNIRNATIRNASL